MIATLEAPAHPHQRPPAPKRAVSVRAALCLGTTLLITLAWLADQVGAAGSWRVVVVVLCTLLVPGTPLALLLGLPSRVGTFALAVAMSLSLTILVSMAFLLARVWDPRSILATLFVMQAGATLVVVLREAGRDDRPTYVPSQDPGARWRVRWDRRLVAPVLAVVGTAMAVVGMTRIDLDAMTGLGVASVFTPLYLAGLGVLSLAIMGELTGPTRTVVMAGMVAALVVVLFAVPALIDSGAPLPTAYLHAGFADYIDRNGAVRTGFDARFSWPGFFAATAYITRVAGLGDATSLLAYSPVVFQLLNLIPLWWIASTYYADRRRAWLVPLLFYVSAWFGQEYYSPQALAFFFYLVIMGGLLWSSQRVRPRTSGSPRRVVRWIEAVRVEWPTLAPGMTGGRSFVLECVLLLIAGAMVVSHQLTPVAMLITLTAITMLGAIRYRLFAVLVLLLFVAWFAYGARDYWSGNLRDLFAQLGQVIDAVGAGTTKRLGGSQEAVALQRLRLAWSGVLFLLFAFGAWRHRRSPIGRLMIVMGASPFAVLAVQGYGGEGVIRAVLYAAPFLAVLAAAPVSVLLRLPRVAAVLGLTAVLLVGSVGLVTLRGANASFERITADQLAAARELLSIAPVGSRLAVAEAWSPLSVTGVGDRRVIQLSKDERCTLPLEPVSLVSCADINNVDYLFLTTGQEAFGVVRRQQEPGWLLVDGVDALVSSGDWRVIIRSDDVVALASIPAPKGSQG